MARHALLTGAVLAAAAVCFAAPSFAAEHRHKGRHARVDDSASDSNSNSPFVRAPAFKGRLNGPIGAYTSRSGNNTMGELPMPPTGRPPTSPASPGSGDPTPTGATSLPDWPR